MSTESNKATPVADPALLEEIRQNVVLILHALKQEGVLVQFETDGQQKVMAKQDYEALIKAKEAKEKEPKKAKSKAKKKK